MTTIYLIRHGDILNPKKILYLQMDQEIKLSPLGKKQIATQAQKLITRHPELVSGSQHIPAIYHSPLLRTKTSAEIIEQILQTHNLIPDKRLIDAGSPAQGMTFTEFKIKYNENLYHPDLLAQGGETIKQIADRMFSALTNFSQQHPNESIIVVSHGDPIRIVQMIAQHIELTKQNMGSDIPPLTEINYPLKSSVTVLEINKNKLTQIDYWKPTIKA